MRTQDMKPETQTWTPGKIKHEIPEPDTGQTDNTTTNRQYNDKQRKTHTTYTLGVTKEYATRLR